jgi:phage portal protein BeeE
LEGLLRGDSAHRAAFYSSGIADGWLLRSEARALENLSQIPGIDAAPTGQATPAAPDYPSKQ